MNLEQLQALSDDELNDLAAIKILWVGIVNGRSDSFTPCLDINSAMKLWNELYDEGWELSLSCDQKVTTPWDCRMFLLDRNQDIVKQVITHDKTAARAITIASILAKE